jgi:protein ImuB
MRTLVAWAPDWPIVSAGFPPDTAVAVLTDRRVIAMSAAARREGVRVGLRRREAESRCPGLVVLDRDLAAEARAFEPVVATVATFCPRLAIIRPGLLALDARGPARYFGGEEALCRRIADAAPLRCGIADGRFAATLAARQGVVVRDNRTFLAPFPVEVLDRPELADLLRRLGVHTLGAFADLPTASVLTRFGADGARAQALARGEDDHPLRMEAPTEELARVMVFDDPVDRVDVAALAGRSLATSLAEALADRGLACSLLRIEAETEHGESLSRLWRGAFGSDAMVERLRWQLEGWVPTAGITLLRLVADEVVGSSQPSFWGGTSGADRRAARGLDRLQGMLGPDAVFTAALGGGRGPADRVVLVPWGEPRPPLQPAPWPGCHPQPAPATVHPSPLRAEVTDAGGEPVAVSARGSPSGAPERLSVDGGPWSDVVAWSGPWTSDERWWGERRRRARFQILTSDQVAHLCLLERGRWWIEATYD